VTPYPTALQDFPTVRQSALATFDQCPLTWRFDQLYGHFSFPAAARGILFHRFFAKCFHEMAAQEEQRLEVDVALAILHEVLRQADVPMDQVVPCPMSEIYDLYWMVKKQASEMTWNIPALIDIEHRLHTTVEYPDPEGGFVQRQFSGQLDVLFAEGAAYERAIVVDAKTGWWLPPPSEISKEGFFQQRAYALLVFTNHPTITSCTLREFYPRYSESREATLYRDQLDDLRLEIAALIERFDRSYEAEMWAPSPGAHCSYCPRPTACPIFPTARRIGRIRSSEEAELVASQVTVAEAAIKQSKEAMKAWSAAHGAIPIRDAKSSDRVYAHRVYKRVERPSREDAMRAMQMGESIEDLYRERVATRFEAHIPKPVIEPEDDELLRQLERSLAQVQERKEEEHNG
jgi:hypothetical protein